MDATGVSALKANCAFLEKSEWHSPEQIALEQDKKLTALATYAAQQSPYFGRRLKEAGLTPDAIGTPTGFRQLPILNRRNIQAAGEDLFTQKAPEQHGPLYTTKSSGSTGEPVVVKRTGLSQFDWYAMTMRDHRWHGRDFSERLCAIRAQIKRPVESPDWGPPVNLLASSGAGLGLPLSLAIEEIVKWMDQFKPGYILLFPSILNGLIGHWKIRGEPPSFLREVRLIGETFAPSARADAQEFLKIKLTDLYSSQEVGIIALQCPDSGLYHVMAETMRVEIVDDEGQPVKAGEIGKVVVTDLRNYATPLVRYELGDYAEASAPCPCGRGLPTLARIVGRIRNLVVLPDGLRHWPQVGFAEYREIAPIRQFQLIQQDATTIEVRLVADTALDAGQEKALANVIQRKLKYPFSLHFKYFSDQLPRGPGGKFEEFVCNL